MLLTPTRSTCLSTTRDLFSPAASSVAVLAAASSSSSVTSSSVRRHHRRHHFIFRSRPINVCAHEFQVGADDTGLSSNDEKCTGRENLVVTAEESVATEGSSAVDDTKGSKLEGRIFSSRWLFPICRKSVPVEDRNSTEMMRGPKSSERLLSLAEESSLLRSHSPLSSLEGTDESTPSYLTSPEAASPEVASPEAASPEAASPEAASPEAATPDSQCSRVGIRVKVTSPLDRMERRRQRQYKRDLSVPLLRGKIHLMLVYACPLWIYGLFQECHSQRALIAAFISVISAFINFGSSAMLHNIRWNDVKTRIFWRRIDHVGIFLMIAGSCAPVPFLLFSQHVFQVWLIFNLSTLTFGLSACLLTDQFSVSGSYSLRAICYVLVGLSNLLFISEFQRVLTSYERLYFYSMATVYVIGAAAYAAKWPNPWTPFIGYHEVFHFLCFLAAIFTYKINHAVLKRSPIRETIDR